MGLTRSALAERKDCRTLKWQVLLLIVCLCKSVVVTGQIRYSIPEELKKGSLVGNIAQDLGIDLNRLRAGRARIVTEDSTQYIELKTDKGLLVVKERIDREQLCGVISPCSFSFEVILENPMELHRVTVEILDINDNAPKFPKNEIKLEISESAAPGARFLLGSAQDPDVGINTLQNYILTPLDIFVLKQHARPNGGKYAEMVLQKPLDREKQDRLSLTLTAVDGGNPQRSGTVNIDVIVLDANDNAPVFNQSVYKATVLENASKNTFITTINASDADTGSNGHVTYSFSDLEGNVRDIFNLDENTGAIYLVGQIDFEKEKKYEINVEAKDHGGLADSSKVVVEVIDVNDNAPVITVMSFSSPVSEDSAPGTTVAIINVKDLDSGENGRVSCSINRNLPFKIISSLTNYYTLVTDAVLDRETTSEYNITVIATDSGSPSLTTSKILTLKVSDVNDNAPVFEQSAYTAYVAENNSPGLSVFSVKAKDSDWNQNARAENTPQSTDTAMEVSIGCLINS
nr:PREDICTED: protocadherin beta-3-like [Lepisosteus oculatus]